jgi:predicted RecB family endonuclease
VGTSPNRFRTAYRRALVVGKRPFTMSRRIFEDGTASTKVVKSVSNFLQSG